MFKRLTTLFALVLLGIGSALAGMSNPVIGGKEMYPTTNIIESAVNFTHQTTLVATVKAAGWSKRHEGEGPLTVFTPTNEASNKLPAGTVDSLLKPENNRC